MIIDPAEHLLPHDSVIIGLDISSRSSGVAWMNRKTGYLLGYKAIVLIPKMPMSQKLYEYRFLLGEILEEIRPYKVAMEELNFFRNAITTRVLGAFRGVTMERVWEYGAGEITFYSQPTLKCNLGIHKRGTTKAETVAMVEYLFKIKLVRDKVKSHEDIADAISVVYKLYKDLKAKEEEKV